MELIHKDDRRRALLRAFEDGIEQLIG